MMESYQKTKIPPPVPPKHHHMSTLVASPVLYQKENIHAYKNGYHHHPAASVTGGALIQTNGMRVKIRINPENPVHENNCRTVLGSTSQTNSGNGLKVNVNGTGGVSTQSHSHDMLLASSACNNCNSNNSATNKQHLRNKFIYQNRNNVCNSNDDFSSTNSIATHNSSSSTKNLIDAFGGANVTSSPSSSSASSTTKSPPSNISSRYLNANGNVHGYFYTNSLPSGQSSPSDNLDSGTCSDVDTGTSPPPQPHHQPPYFGAKKRSAAAKISPPPSQHQRSGSLNSSGIGVDSEDEDNASCDSINSSEYNGENEHSTLPIISAAILKCNSTRGITSSTSTSTSSSSSSTSSTKRTYEENGGLPHSSCPISADHHRGYVANNDENRRQEIGYASPPPPYDNDVEENTDKYLHFHLNENNFNKDDETRSEDDSFAGFKSLIEKSSPVTTIQSARGTVRGVKNRVRAGIATFLNNNVTKTWQDKEAGKVVVYTTTMGIIRETYHRCLKVRQILKTHLVKFEEKDVFMSREVQKEIRERMKIDVIVVPQVFVEGLHIGDAETIERLNESGELRKILKPYKSADALNTCQVCGGYRLLPCNICNGSKKSVRRPNFTELVPLKCMNCDEVGLIKCYAC